MIDNRLISSNITLKDLKNCAYGGSFLDDASRIVVSNTEFTKIKSDLWQAHTTMEHWLNKNLTSDELFKFIQSNKSDKGYIREIYANV